MRNFLLINDKKKIIEEAYCTQENSVKATARKYDIEPFQI